MKAPFRTLLATAGLALIVFTRTGLADTISLSDLSQDPAAGIYKYTISLDAAADVEQGDGFVLYDFGNAAHVSISGLPSSDFNFISTLTSNALNDSSAVNDSASFKALVSEIPFDDPNIANLNVIYSGAAPLLGAHTGVLTVTTTPGAGNSTSVFASVDHSGQFQGDAVSFATNPQQGFDFSVSTNTLTVPNVSLEFATGVPEISVGGLASLAIVMIGALGILESSKTRHRAA